MFIKEGGTFELLKYGPAPRCKLSIYILNSRSEVPRNQFGRTFFSGVFDAYSDNIIAPDHLLAGIGKCVLETFFSEYVYIGLRCKLDLPLCNGLFGIGLETRKTIFNHGKKKLLRLTLSVLYSLLTIIPIRVETLTFDQGIQSFNTI